MQRLLDSHSGDRYRIANEKPNDMAKTVAVSKHCTTTNNIDNKNLEFALQQPESSPCIGSTNQVIDCEVLIFDAKQR